MVYQPRSRWRASGVVLWDDRMRNVKSREKDWVDMNPIIKHRGCDLWLKLGRVDILPSDLSGRSPWGHLLPDPMFSHCKMRQSEAQVQGSLHFSHL